MKVCTECGSDLKPTAKFCTSCGAKNDSNQELQSADVNEKKITPSPSEVKTKASSSQQTAAITIDSALIQKHFFSYIYFLRDTLKAPSGLLSSESWINGLISIVMLVLLQTVLIQESFLTMFFENTVVQALFIIILFLINKFLIGGSDTFTDVVRKYGGMVNTQSILLLLVLLTGVDRPAGMLFLAVFVLNQINIFNIYVFDSQSSNSVKIDRYYLLLLSYVALGVILYFISRNMFI